MMRMILNATYAVKEWMKTIPIHAIIVGIVCVRIVIIQTIQWLFARIAAKSFSSGVLFATNSFLNWSQKTQPRGDQPIANVLNMIIDGLIVTSVDYTIALRVHINADD